MLIIIIIVVVAIIMTIIGKANRTSEQITQRASETNGVVVVVLVCQAGAATLQRLARLRHRTHCSCASESHFPPAGPPGAGASGRLRAAAARAPGAAHSRRSKVTFPPGGRRARTACRCCALAECRLSARPRRHRRRRRPTARGLWCPTTRPRAPSASYLAKSQNNTILASSSHYLPLLFATTHSPLFQSAGPNHRPHPLLV